MRETGNKGEGYAAEYLKNNGYNTLARNYSSRYGEVDIIASKDEFIVFVEVKTRNSRCAYSPREAVDIAKMRKITKTALCYLQEHPSTLQPRFDVIEIVTKANEPFSVLSCDHIINAFDSVL
ncbi:YraN family protein [Acetanaerobacterium elongatum]|uniref:UPF0102 protein SAMN05192585_1197 n=1 Tax=Acetanaerobacterium elongatum TaxID=258515 RepID=A0A1H0BA11_9FIRM|nr:YraN family protein [Acetanaerobacterium elongatum]SDN42485.1 putative endonuclease [Acetanaerobacterium elongatum]